MFRTGTTMIAVLSMVGVIQAQTPRQLPPPLQTPNQGPKTPQAPRSPKDEALEKEIESAIKAYETSMFRVMAAELKATPRTNKIYLSAPAERLAWTLSTLTKTEDFASFRGIGKTVPWDGIDKVTELPMRDGFSVRGVNAVYLAGEAPADFADRAKRMGVKVAPKAKGLIDPETVNRWVSEETDERVNQWCNPKTFKEENIHVVSVSVLDAEWVAPFGKPIEGKFYAEKGVEDVEFMRCQTTNVHFERVGAFSGWSLITKGQGSISYFPTGSDKKSLELLELLGSDSIPVIRSAPSGSVLQYYELQIPSFKFSTTVNITAHYEAMGMKKGTLPDFNHITSIKLVGKGTVGALLGTPALSDENPIPVFRMDRPGVWIIVNKANGNFVGVGVISTTK